jgi:hypothetical protein
MKNKPNYYLSVSLILFLAGCNFYSHKPEKEQVDFNGVVTKEDLKNMPIGKLRELTGNELPWTRLSAAQLLADQPKKNIPFFVESLEDKDWRVVRAAQDGIKIILKTPEGKEKGPTRKKIISAIPSLKKNLKNKHYYVRIGALQCLEAIGPEAAVAGDEICDATEDEDYLGVQPAAFKAIQAVGPENFKPERLFVVMEKSVKSPKCIFPQSCNWIN